METVRAMWSSTIGCIALSHVQRGIAVGIHCVVCRVSNRNRRASGCREVTCRDHHVSRDWDDLRCRDTEDERCRDIGT